MARRNPNPLSFSTIIKVIFYFLSLIGPNAKAIVLSGGGSALRWHRERTPPISSPAQWMEQEVGVVILDNVLETTPIDETRMFTGSSTPVANSPETSTLWAAYSNFG